MVWAGRRPVAVRVDDGAAFGGGQPVPAEQPLTHGWLISVSTSAPSSPGTGCCQATVPLSLHDDATFSAQLSIIEEHLRPRSRG
ncbi:hypothetical protein ADL03_06835 [Nocardia sp. NRRL S-836]|nr:hypothetical protein ADL03_06835 [Nocardia sp. NRRL S-836]